MHQCTIAPTKNNQIPGINSTIIKLCLSGTQTCVLPLFCNRDLEINPMTLKLEGDLDILNTYLLGMSSNQNFVYSIHREKVPWYWVYCATCFVIVETRVKHKQQSNLFRPRSFIATSNPIIHFL